MWETYLRIDVKPGSPRKASAPLAVVKVLREQVLPLVRRLEDRDVIEWYSFLVHGAPDGEKPGAYIHLRMSIVDGVAFLSSRLRDLHDGIKQARGKWTEPKRIVAPACREIAGFDRTAFTGVDIRCAWKLIGEQSAWVLDLIEQHSDKTSDLAVVLHAVQFMHYFSNMLQLPSVYPDWYASAAKRHGRQHGVKKRRG